MTQDIFSEIPLRTWRWLGVNEALLPEELQQVPNDLSNKNTQSFPEKLPWEMPEQISVPAGETVEKIFVFRSEQVTNIRAEVARGGTLNLICIQLLPTDKAYAGKVLVTAGEKAKINYTAVEVGAVHTLTNLQIELDGNGSAADVAAVYFGDADRRLDLNYVITHRGTDTDADMQVRGVLQDASDKIFRGTLDFRQGSRGSVGREKEEVILLNEGIRNRSVPLMLAQEDAVNGQHAVSAGHMDRDKLFYLMSRGLDEKEARKLAVDALFATVLERIPNADLREEISREVEERIEHGQR